ncbi:MAG: hypothetical protein HY695_05515 [Deltaproteobacteria bacterium]|nr:hypothetical protein [Deltaproteobacteria bacterium]
MKGQGKSHDLLVIYHVFINPDVAKPWMESHGYSWSPPKDVIVVVEKFTDQYLPFDSLWTYLGQKLGVTWAENHAPSLGEFRTAVQDRHVVLIFDELERGITNILDSGRRSQNLSFLQMISEESNRSPNVTLVAAIYSGAVEPGITLKRIQRLELRFRKAEERAAIVRHRLFSNADSYDRKAAEDLTQSYLNTWRRMGLQVTDDYLARLKSSFPFLPELIDLIFERMGGGEAFQGTRGALGLLGAMLDASGPESRLLTAAHCKLTDSACADRLQDLDPAGTTISCAAGNLRDLSRQPYAEAIASATLLASLVPGRARGLSKEELIHHVAEPGCDPNQFEATLEAFRRYGSYFHKEEDRFYFDIEENEEAKVELEALRSGSDEAARQEIGRLWLTELFKESQQAVIHTDFEMTRAALSGMKRAPRFVLAPRRLSNPERHNLYHGTEYRNQILLLEPREDQANHMINSDLLSAARRCAAATGLAGTARTAERRDRYEKIAARERKLVLDTLKQGGLVYIRVERWDETAEGTAFEIEPLGQASTREDVVTFLRTQVYPQTYFVEHLRDRLPGLIGQPVEQVDRLYRTTLGFPVPLKEDMISGAILLLVEDRDARPLGLLGPRGRSFCGEYVALTPSELDAAVLSAPWPQASIPPAVQRPLPIPSEQPSGGTSEVSAPPITAVPPGVDTDELATPFSRSPGDLRQQIAARLVDVGSAGIQQVSFRILANAQDVDLSGFSSGVRGGISGRGSLDVQIELICPGPMTKAEVEAKCEQLPQLPQGNYSARLQVVRKRDEDA